MMALWWVENPQSRATFGHRADINELLVTSALPMKRAAPFGRGLLAGAVAAGGIAAIASSSGGDSLHHSDGDNPPPITPI